jgi:hypothetical protein
MNHHRLLLACISLLRVPAHQPRLPAGTGTLTIVSQDRAV